MSEANKKSSADLINQECSKLQGENKVLRQMCVSFNPSMSNDDDQLISRSDSADLSGLLETLKEENHNLKESLGLMPADKGQGGG